MTWPRGALLVAEAEAAATELEQALRQKPVNAERAGKAFTRSSAALWRQPCQQVLFKLFFQRW